MNAVKQKKCHTLTKKNAKSNRNIVQSEALVDVGQKESLPVYKCEDCQITFVHRGDLSRHKKSIHEGIRYECDKCDYMATQQSNLKRHQRNKHSIDSLSF